MKKFIIILVFTFLVGTFPSWFIKPSIDGLALPPFYPPTILFPIVWTILYILMSISLYLASKNTNSVYPIYIAQITVNSLWTVIFFGLRLFTFGYLWIILLITLVIIMMYKFYKQNKISMYLLIPYLIWLFIALYLNIGIAVLN